MPDVPLLMTPYFPHCYSSKYIVKCPLEAMYVCASYWWLVSFGQQHSKIVTVGLWQQNLLTFFLFWKIAHFLREFWASHSLSPFTHRMAAILECDFYWQQSEATEETSFQMKPTCEWQKRKRDNLGSPLHSWTPESTKLGAVRTTKSLTADSSLGSFCL